MASGGLASGAQMPISSPEMGTVTTLQTERSVYRSYFIDFEQDADGSWHVVGITHCYNDSALFPPAFKYPDRATAERYAKLAIDGQA